MAVVDDAFGVDMDEEGLGVSSVASKSGGAAPSRGFTTMYWSVPALAHRSSMRLNLKKSRPLRQTQS